MPVITLTTTAVVAAVTFALQGFNTWRGKINAEKIRKINFEYEKQRIERNAEESKKLLQQMLDVRKEIAEEEQKNAFELLKISHDETIKEIAEKAFFSKWPLHIHPIVIRNDFPLNSISELQNHDVIEPIHVIIAPTRDRSFRLNIEPTIVNRLNSAFSKYYNSRNSHRVIFYKDAWIDDTLDADETIVRNIYSRIKYTPTILISFKVKKDRIVLEVSHWGINGCDSTTELNSSVFCQNIELDIWGSEISRNRDYNMADIEIVSSQLVDYTLLTVGILVDKLMWFRYQLLPIFPKTLKMGMLNLKDEDLAYVYTFYKKIFKDSLDSGFISRFFDYKKVIGYCNSVDVPFGKNENFVDTNLGNNKIATFNALPDRIKFLYLRYIAEHRDIYNDTKLIKTFYEIWFISTLNNQVLQKIATDSEFSFKALPLDFGSASWKSKWNSMLVDSSHIQIESALKDLRAKDSVFAPRIDMRMFLVEHLEDDIINQIIPEACAVVCREVKELYSNKYKSLIKTVIESIFSASRYFIYKFQGIDLSFDITSEANNLLKSLYEELEKKLSKIKVAEIGVDFQSKIHKTLNTYDAWVFKVAEDWIEYHFMGTDVIRDIIPMSKRNDEDTRIKTELDSLSQEILAAYITKIVKLDSSSHISSLIALGSALSIILGKNYSSIIAAQYLNNKSKK